MLICPLCHTALSNHAHGLSCINQHNFDRAKQGYYHLLPVQHKKSRAPGDNQAMVEARRRFLSQNFYLPIAEKLTQLVSDKNIQQWLDIGCGEGFYTKQLANALPNSQGVGLDISKDAVKQASTKNSPLTWLVASMNNLPVASQSMDLLTSIFSPLDWQESLRVLTKQGTLIKVGPASKHLIELRQQLYAQVHDYDDSKHLQEAPAALKCTATDYLSFQLELTSQQARQDLLAMTPHGWRATEQQRAGFIDQAQTVTVAVRFDSFSLQ